MRGRSSFPEYAGIFCWRRYRCPRHDKCHFRHFEPLINCQGPLRSSMTWIGWALCSRAISSMAPLLIMVLVSFNTLMVVRGNFFVVISTRVSGEVRIFVEDFSCQSCFICVLWTDELDRYYRNEATQVSGTWVVPGDPSKSTCRVGRAL